MTNCDDSELLDPCGDTVDTLCNLDVTDNVWVEGVVDLSRGMRGICLLDVLSREEVTNILQNVPQARMDLPKVTNDPEALALLHQTNLNVVTDPVVQNIVSSGLPFYTLFNGNPPRTR
jgi:hypothetical protein